ncbi:MAG: hypothetical protein HOE58_01425 [Porticoccaceae bacterium]|jgi:hypothetical protein|nr:hypothetical protein [Porticoccaceae bacterium]MBT3798466.1 hypothetical protein [Porticoccaceae bacterium]MBT4163454.1 hypothetical protein [Porticoccaceae bacterium]MBT4211471.1 hypothetical protein [Porticoccaceae bacterium]MBT4591185.1 hypothetical protein [Porticoccaceae bacterium]
MGKISIVNVMALLLLTSGCAHKELNPQEAQAYVDKLCRSAANYIPAAGNMTMLPNVSYSECMVNHGYLEKLSSL